MKKRKAVKGATKRAGKRKVWKVKFKRNGYGDWDWKADYWVGRTQLWLTPADTAPTKGRAVACAKRMARAHNAEIEII